MATYVISDIHGCYKEFQQMLELLKMNDEDLLILAGDYVDKGTQTCELLNWLADAPPLKEIMMQSLLRMSML